MVETCNHYSFFVEATKILGEAHIIINALPNVDTPSVEQAVAQLDAVHIVLLNINDLLTTSDEQEQLVDDVSRLLQPLEEYLESPSPSPFAPNKTPTGHVGPAKSNIDLQRALELHDLGNSWQEISGVMGVCRKTLYNHLQAAGLSRSRPEYSTLDDDELDLRIAEITCSHPFIGSAIVRGHLEAMGIHVPILCIKQSLKRVDAEAVLVRWSGIIKRRVYRVKGANALWHQDGNEKLRPWGFYVHGCIDGYSRLVVYLECCSNKRAATVGALFKEAVGTFGWPSRVRGDFGTENNNIEKDMIARWGKNHRAYLRGHSVHNVRIERLWRDVRKDSLEAFCQVFLELNECNLLDMDDIIHRVCLFLVYQPHIQASLIHTNEAWNHHQIRTAGNRTPIALFELSREMAIQRGYWTGDPGDDPSLALDPQYGHDGEAPMPPSSELRDDPIRRQEDCEFDDKSELQDGHRLLEGFNLNAEDGNWGIDVYCEAVKFMYSKLDSLPENS